MKEYVQDYAREKTLRSLYLRERMSSDSMLLVFNKYLNLLHRVYDKYCTRRQCGLDKNGVEQAELLSVRRGSTLKSSGIVLKNSNVFDAEEDKTISFDEFRKFFICGLMVFSVFL